jgi:hypothetical protein
LLAGMFFALIILWIDLIGKADGDVCILFPFHRCNAFLSSGEYNGVYFIISPAGESQDKKAD